MSSQLALLFITIVLWGVFFEAVIAILVHLSMVKNEAYIAF